MQNNTKSILASEIATSNSIESIFIFAEEEKHTISKAHYQEWLDSGVDREIIELNVRSLSGDEPYEYLLYGLPNAERRNDGRLRDKWLYRYRHTEEGGWFCSGGIDTEWGCFKPDKPRIDSGKGKSIKYEHPPKTPTEIFQLRITWRVGLAVAIKQGLEEEYNERMPPDSSLNEEDREFWAWIITTPQMPLIFTEGAKKAGALLSAGYCAIALPGIWGAYRKAHENERGQVTNLPYLIPQIEAFCQPNRRIYLAFDQDNKRKTRRNVAKAVASTSRLLERKDCQALVIEWKPELGKGADDVIVTHGVDAFDQLFESVRSIDDWQANKFGAFTFTPDIEFNQKYLGNFSIPLDKRLVVIKSPKGTGKTHQLISIVEKAQSKNQKVLIIGHRNQLLIELANKFGVDHVWEMYSSQTRGALGIALCVDSLHPKSQARFNPQEWTETLIIIDEAQQVVEHLLNANTAVKKNRVEILKNFQQIIQIALTTGQLILSDADLSDTTVNYIRRLAGVSVEPFVVVNNYQSQGYQTINYDQTSPEALMHNMEKHIDQKERIFICTSSQKDQSKWGSKNLEKRLSRKYQHLRILRFDAESVSDPNHEAYGCIDKLNEVLPNYDVVIASPTIETGVSIDIKGHFDSVWGIFQGNQSANSVRQALARVRENIPRHIWIKKVGLNRLGNGSTNIKSILASEHKKTRLLVSQINQFDNWNIDLSINENFQPKTINTWAMLAARNNLQAKRYRENIIHDLKEEGQMVTNFQAPEGDLEEISNFEQEKKQIKADMKALAQEQYKIHCEAIASAESLSELEHKKLKKKKVKTGQQRDQEKKGDIKRRYLMNEITPELVELDDKGLYPKLQLLYYFTIGKKHLKTRDGRVAKAQVEKGEGDIFKPDFNKSLYSLKVKSLELLNIEQFLDPNRTWTNADLEDWGKQIRGWRGEIKSILGVKITDKTRNITIANKLLKLIDNKLEYVGRFGCRGNTRRTYKLKASKDYQEEILALWLDRDDDFVSIPLDNNTNTYRSGAVG